MTPLVFKSVEMWDDLFSCFGKKKAAGKAFAIPEIILRKVRSGEISNVVALVGSGVNASAGVPDLRDHSSYVMRDLQRIYDLPRPQAVFDQEFFLENPAPLWHLAAQYASSKVKPTSSHWFIGLLNHKGILRRLYTTNVRISMIECAKEEDLHYCVTGRRTLSRCWTRRRRYRRS